MYDPEKKENVATITATNDMFERHANPYDEEFDRIAVKDAIRTFRSKENQHQMIGMDDDKTKLCLFNIASLRFLFLLERNSSSSYRCCLPFSHSFE